MKYEVVGITYIDITQVTGGSLDDKLEPLVYWAFGVLLEDNKDTVVLGQTIAVRDTDEGDRMNVRLIIPRGCITDITHFAQRTKKGTKDE